MPDVCSPDWPTCVDGVSSCSRYLMVSETQVHHNNTNNRGTRYIYRYTHIHIQLAPIVKAGNMRSLGGSVMFVLVTFCYCDVTVSDGDKETEGTCSADIKDCAG